VREAVPVDADADQQATETVRQLRALSTPDGAVALARASALLADGVDAVAALTRLRAEVGTDLAGPAWGIARQRQKARPTFGADAERLLFTSDTLEQAGRPVLAERRAARLLARGAGSVADLGCAAAVLDPARRAGGRRQLDPDRWSPPWTTVTALLDAVPAAVVKVAPGLDHDRVPDGVEAEWVSVGGSIVEALLWGREPSAVWRRATLVKDGVVHEVTAAADPGPAPVGPVRGWLHEPDPALIRSGLMSLIAAGATLIDPTIAYLTSDGPADSPWLSSYRVTEWLPFNLKKLKALLRARGIGRVVVKKRGSPIEPEALARQLRGPGNGSAVVVVTRVAGAPTVLLCAPLSG